MLFVMLFGSIFSAFAQKQNYNYSDSWGNNGYTVTDSKSTAIEINYSISEFALSENEIKGETLQNIELSGIFLFNEAGMPDLPGSSKLIAIPQGSTPKLKIVDYRTETIKNVNMAPAPVIPLDTDDYMDYSKNEKVFSQNSFYPKEPIKISSIKQIRGVDAVMLGITPFQYNPTTKELIVYRDIKIEISFEGGNGHFGEDRLRTQSWEAILNDAFINYNSLPKIDFNNKNKGAKDGEFEYVILTLDNSDFTDWAKTIADFRRKQGINTGIFTIADVPGGNTVNSIEAWVDNMYNTWATPPAAILILADYGTGTSGITSQEYPHPYSGTYISDNHYADVDDDDLPDIAFARITANDATQLEVMITKFIEYESAPPTSVDFYNHPVSALGWQTARWFQICSEVIGGYWKNELGKDPVRINAVYDGNPNSDPWSEATNTATVLNYFGTSGLNYIPASPSELGGWTGGNATAINNAINSGAFMLQHRDHGLEEGWGEPYYRNPNINELNNTDLTFIMSINCLTGKFDHSSESFAEKFHRYTSAGNNSGALGLIAASQVSYSFVNDTYVWGCYDNMWPDFMPDETPNPENRLILPAFANVAGKNFLYQSSWPYNTENKQITYRLFHHHGDAFLNVYSEVPTDLTVDCNNVILFGNNNFDVDTEEGAFIAITFYNETTEEVEILGTALSIGGTTTINMTGVPTPESQVLMTITKQNKFRYEQLIDVITPSGPYIVKESFVINDATGNENGEADYCETLNIDITLENVGTEVSNSVTATLTTDDPYVISISNNVNIDFGNIDAGSTTTSSNNFTITLADSIPDQYRVNFDFLMMDVSKATYETGISFKVNAPDLGVQFDNILDESAGLSFASSPILLLDELTLYNYDISVISIGGNNNGMLDPGETVEITINGLNNGHADFYEALCKLESTSSYITIHEDVQILGNIPLEESIEAVFIVTIDENTPIGEIVDLNFTLYSDIYTAPEYNELLEIELKVGLIVEDFETGDFSAYSWDNDITYPWITQESVVHEGTYSAKSASISHNQTTSLEITLDVLNDDVISFWAKTSSENNFDYFKFYIDGDEKNSWSNEVDWEEVTWDVTAGTHTFKWKYSKDGSVSNGDDCGYLDYILFPTFSGAKDTKDGITINGTDIPTWLTLTDNGNGTANLNGTAPEGSAVYDVIIEATENTFTETQEYQVTVDDVVTIKTTEGFVNIYPNPVTDVLHIDFSEKSDNDKIIIYDLSGRILSEQKLNSQQNEVNVNNLSSGTYFIELIRGSDIYKQQIIIK